MNETNVCQVALNLVTVFVSTTEWEHLATVAGTLLDPYRITIDPLGKEGALNFNYHAIL